MGQTASDFVKTQKDIEIMRQGGQILASILSDIKDRIKPGVEVLDLEKLFIELCNNHKVIPTCKNYSPWGVTPFPTGLCISINNESIHCYPKPNVKLKSGDLISVDTVIAHKGLNVDASFAMGVGKVSDLDQKLLETCERALNEAISRVKDGARIGELSYRMQKTVEQAGFNVLHEYGGHGIGKEMHEWPWIPTYGSKNWGPKLKEGMTICIESLVCSGKDGVKNSSFWETYMGDGGKFVQFEHTILVTKSGCEILTLAQKANKNGR